MVSRNCLDKAWKGTLVTEGAGRHDESAEEADDESKHRPEQAVGSQSTSSSYSRTFTFSIYNRFELSVNFFVLLEDIHRLDNDLCTSWNFFGK